MNYTRQMASYHEAWPAVIPTSNAPSRKTHDQSPNLSMLSLGPSKVQEKIPALPFLVPAVIEKLQATPKYASITIVQPGEADLYCARHVKEHGGIVLTGDSDLLVHDLGTAGSVAFLKDLNVVENLNRKSLRCQVYEISTIVERLALKPIHGIRPLAFEMVMDAHASFLNLVQRAKGCKAMTEYPGIYAEFAAEYLALSKDLHVEYSAESRPNSIQSKLRSLDPRISEFVLQFPLPAAAARLPFERQRDREVQIFLPFLIDCPSKTSAWEASTATRQLAYGLLNLITPPQHQVSSIIEHRRQQSKESRGREWALPNEDQIAEAAQDLVSLHDRIIGLSITNTEAWRFMAYYQDLELAESTGKESLGMKVTAEGNHNKRLSWDAVHFSAQLQGSYYSFRMLKQVLGVVLACRPASKLPASLNALGDKLKHLEGLELLPGFYADLRAFRGTEDRSYLRDIAAWLESPSDAEAKEEAARNKKEAAERKKEKRNKSKRKRGALGEDRSVMPTAERQKTNMFELLGDQ